MPEAGNHKDATTPSDPPTVAALAELDAFYERLRDEADAHHDTASYVRRIAFRWHGLMAYRVTHAMPEGALEEATNSCDDLFKLITEAPAHGLSDLVLKLAVLHVAMGEDLSTYPKQRQEAQLLAAILADAVMLAPLSPAGGAP